MKNLIIFTMLLIGLGFTSCLNNDKENAIPSDQTEQIDSHEKGITITLDFSGAKLHRGKKILNDGTLCDCEACFGICGVKIGVEITPEFTKVRFVKENEDTYIYLFEAIDHAEDLFYVDNELIVPVQEGDQEVDRMLMVGEYQFEQVGIDYEDPNPETPTFGRVRLDVQ